MFVKAFFIKFFRTNQPNDKSTPRKIFTSRQFLSFGMQRNSVKASSPITKNRHGINWNPYLRTSTCTLARPEQTVSAQFVELGTVISYHQLSSAVISCHSLYPWLPRCRPIFNALTKWRKATISFVMCVRPSAGNDSVPTGRTSMTHDTWVFFRKFVDKIPVLLKSGKNNEYFTRWRLYVCDNMSLN